MPIVDPSDFGPQSAPAPEFGDAPFQFERSFFAPAIDGQAANSLSALRGSATINLALTPYIVNASSAETKAVAFEPSMLGISYGNVTTFETFNFSTQDGFTLNFVLTRNTLSLVFTASSSAVVTFLVLLASVAGSMVGAFSMLVKQLEQVFEIRDASASDLPQHAPQMDADADAARGKLAPATIEMHNIMFAADHIDTESGKSHQSRAETNRALESKIRQLEHELQLSNQRNAAAHEEYAGAYEQRLALHQQSIQRLTATLADVVQLLPASDRSRRLQLNLDSTLTPAIENARHTASEPASESALPSSNLTVSGPLCEPPSSSRGMRGGADGYGQMCDDE
jgi:hypothetical protein